MSDGYLSIWGPPKPKGGHVVAAIRFMPRTPADDALMECKCGWSGLVSEWEREHGGRVSRSWRDEYQAQPRPLPPPTDACRRGHERTPANSYEYQDRNGYRVRACRECHRESNRAYKTRRAA